MERKLYHDFADRNDRRTEQNPAFEGGALDIPYGFAWMMQKAEKNAAVPVPLYSELWPSLAEALKRSGLHGDWIPVPGAEEANLWELTTDVKAIQGNYVVVFGCDLLKKADVRAIDALPADQNGWGKLLEDVYALRKHYRFKLLKPLFPDQGFIATQAQIMPAEQAKQWDKNWRVDWDKCCVSSYFTEVSKLIKNRKDIENGKLTDGDTMPADQEEKATWWLAKFNLLGWNIENIAL